MVELSNLSSKMSALFFHSPIEEYAVFMFEILSLTKLNSCSVIICSLYGCCALAFAANLLTVPPNPSHGPFPREVAKKCHFLSIPKSALGYTN